MIDLSGKKALVTGGSRGIGRATCLKLAELGADIGINYFGSQEKAEKVASEISGIGRKSVLLKTDVSDHSKVNEMVEEFVRSEGGLDILINNAGINRDQLLVRMKESDWDEVISTNLKGTFNCTQAAAKIMMKNRSGVIINLSSVVALTGNAGQVNYSSAKAGIIGLTKTIARELASRSVRVNAIAPGFIETEMTAGLSSENRENIAQRVPLGKFGSSDDVANAIAFLVSDEAKYITGQTLVVDGGLSI